MNPIIKLSDNAALKIKEIMSNAEQGSLGVRVSVKSGGCAGMSYVMEYTKEANPNDEVIEEIRKIYDPELPVNIYELGLIYDIQVENEKFAKIKMTLTTPNCPVAESLPKEVKEGAMQVEEIDDVDLQLVWDPPWTKEMMSDAAKLELNL